MTQPPMANGRTDEIFTPAIGLVSLLPNIRHEWIILEPAYGQGHLAKLLTDAGLAVVGYAGFDFLVDEPPKFDCVITNPPYSKKVQFLSRCYELGKPFALLMPLTALEGKARGELYKKYGIELIIPNKRINFIMPNGGSSSWFQAVWFTHGLGLPAQLNFFDVSSVKFEPEAKNRMV